MKYALILLFVLFVSTLKAQSDSTIVSVDELLEKSRVLYDEADKTLGQIDSVFVKKVLVIASWDSAGIRKRIVTYTDSFSLDILK